MLGSELPYFYLNVNKNPLRITNIPILPTQHAGQIFLDKEFFVFLSVHFLVKQFEINNHLQSEKLPIRFELDPDT